MQNINIRIERRRIKNVNIYLKAPYREVLVTAPLRMAESRIEEIVAEKEPWIRRSLSRLLEEQKRREESGTDTEIPLSEEEKKLCRERLIKLIPKYLSLWEERLKVRAGGYRLRVMRRAWGVCHTKTGSITFNVYLGKMAEPEIEYVVLHELVHLLEPSHNRRFHALMEKAMPDYKERKKRLNSGLSSDWEEPC